MSAAGPVRAAVSGRDDWETPDDLFQVLNWEWKFTLDAAADHLNHKCDNYLTGPCEGTGECGCGLCGDWGTDVVWVNPPYGRQIRPWVGKFTKAVAGGSNVVTLLPANTDTRWFKEVWENCCELRFLYGRVPFVGTTSSNTGGSMVAVYNRLLWHPVQKKQPKVSLWDWKNNRFI